MDRELKNSPAADAQGSGTRAESHRDLLVGIALTDKMTAWKILEHPHSVIGGRRGFQVRLYQHAKWPEPYFVALVSQKEGRLMGGETAPTEAAARHEAFTLLASLDGYVPPINLA